MFFIGLVGLGGFVILIALGLWQVQRLAVKESVLSGIEQRIAAAPVDLPSQPDAASDRYLPVTVDGTFQGTPLRVLISQKNVGAGWRLIQAFETTDGRRILIDRGVIPTDRQALPGPGAGPMRVTGNLHWPDEVDGFTPDPDPAGNIWYARDVPMMARTLTTEPVMIIARAPTGDAVTPLPVGTQGIPNNHLEYAITWFLLAVVWLGMTGLWLWRIRRRNGEEST